MDAYCIIKLSLTGRPRFLQVSDVIREKGLGTKSRKIAKFTGKDHDGPIESF